MLYNVRAYMPKTSPLSASLLFLLHLFFLIDILRVCFFSRHPSQLRKTNNLVDVSLIWSLVWWMLETHAVVLLLLNSMLDLGERAHAYNSNNIIPNWWLASIQKNYAYYGVSALASPDGLKYEYVFIVFNSNDEDDDDDDNQNVIDLSLHSLTLRPIL